MQVSSRLGRAVLGVRQERRAETRAERRGERRGEDDANEHIEAWPAFPASDRPSRRTARLGLAGNVYLIFPTCIAEIRATPEYDERT